MTPPAFLPATPVAPHTPRPALCCPRRLARCALRPPAAAPTPGTRKRAPAPLPARLLATAAAAAAFLLPLPARCHPAPRAQPPAAHRTHRTAHPARTASSAVTVAPRRPHRTPATSLATTPAVAIPPAVRVVLPRRADPPAKLAAKVLLLAGLAVIIITAATIAVFWVIQDSLVYKPVKVWRGSPKASGMPHYDDVNYCTVDGAEISGWFIRQPPGEYEHARTLLYFHGTDKNASFRLKKVIGFYERCRCNILLLSYRGYGLSTGKPNEKGMRVDAESAYDYLRSRGDVDVSPGGNLWVYGESLGGAVAIHFSNVYQHCINALILENTFTSLLDMIKLEFPILGVFRYLSRNRWQSKKRIGDLHIPLLFLSGLRDSYIPPYMMRTMHQLATKSPLKEFVEFEKGTHNGTWTREGFYDAVAQFMDRVDNEKQKVEERPTAGAVAELGIDDGNRIAAAA